MGRKKVLTDMHIARIQPARLLSRISPWIILLAWSCTGVGQARNDPNPLQIDRSIPAPDDLPQSRLVGPTAPPGPLTLEDVIRISLESNVEILVRQEDVIIADAQLQQVSSVFNPQIDATLDSNETRVNSALSTAPEDLFISESETSTYSLAVTKTFRSGISLTPSLEYDLSASNTDGLVPSNRGIWQLNITVPLLKGFGRIATAGKELAAQKNVEAVQFAYEHTLSEQLSLVVAAYWSYLSAARNLDILQRAEQRGELLLRQTEALIEANQLPAAEISKSQADLSARRADRSRGELSLFSARRNLGLLMGLSKETVTTLTEPSTPFTIVPPVDPTSLLDQSERYVDLALQQRRDLQAAAGQTKATEVLRKQAEALDKIQVDFTLGVGYSGYSPGRSFSAKPESFYRHLEGPSYEATFNIGWGWNRNLEKGTLRERLSREAQARYAEVQLEREIYSGVIRALENLRTASLTLEESNKAQLLFQKSLELEAQKLQLGQATIIDVINLQERLTQAELELTQAQLQYVNAIVELRFQTGTLLNLQEDMFQLNQDALTTLP